jgi:hypothetical protein
VTWPRVRRSMARPGRSVSAARCAREAAPVASNPAVGSREKCGLRSRQAPVRQAEADARPRSSQGRRTRRGGASERKPERASMYFTLRLRQCQAGEGRLVPCLAAYDAHDDEIFAVGTERRNGRRRSHGDAAIGPSAATKSACSSGSLRRGGMASEARFSPFDIFELERPPRSSQTSPSSLTFPKLRAARDLSQRWGKIETPGLKQPAKILMQCDLDHCNRRTTGNNVKNVAGSPGDLSATAERSTFEGEKRYDNYLHPFSGFPEGTPAHGPLCGDQLRWGWKRHRQLSKLRTWNRAATR